MKTLVYGYGNPGRKDDGLGNAFIEVLEEWVKNEDLNHISLDSNYQLNIEDAEVISNYDLVIFVDASIEENIEPYVLTKVDPNDSRIEFTMHAVSVPFVLDLCQKIHKKTPLTYLLHIKGYEWDFVEELTSKALENLNLAVEFIKPILINPNILIKRPNIIGL